jgi:hypothetical protein
VYHTSVSSNMRSHLKTHHNIIVKTTSGAIQEQVNKFELDSIRICLPDCQDFRSALQITAYQKRVGSIIYPSSTLRIGVPVYDTREFMRGSIPHRRTQFPLTVAYVITVHKSLGMTVDKAVLNLAQKDFILGLAYVGVGWVKYLKGLMFEESFDLASFRCKD